MLVNAEQIECEIQSELSEDFSFAGTLIEFAMEKTSHFKLCVEGRSDLSADCIHVAINVFSDALRTYEGTIILCQKGLENQANILLRTLLEESLSLDFLLREEFPVKGYSKKLRAESKNLNADFRRKMYCASRSFSKEKQFNEMEKDGLLNDRIIDDVELKIRKEADFWRNELGEEWACEVKKKGFSGLPTVQLADNLGVKPMYSTLFRTGSRSVHSAIGPDYTEINHETKIISLKLEPSIDSISQRLYFAVMVFAFCLEDLNKNLQLNQDDEILSIHEKRKCMRWKVEKMDRQTS